MEKTFSRFLRILTIWDSFWLKMLKFRYENPGNLRFFRKITNFKSTQLFFFWTDFDFFWFFLIFWKGLYLIRSFPGCFKNPTKIKCPPTGIKIRDFAKSAWAALGLCIGLISPEFWDTMFVNPPGGGGVPSGSGDLRIFFKSSGDLRGNPF